MNSRDQSTEIAVLGALSLQARFAFRRLFLVVFSWPRRAGHFGWSGFGGPAGPFSLGKPGSIHAHGMFHKGQVM